MEKNKQNRKQIPLYRGLIKYFPDALCEVARVSYIGSKQHHPDLLLSKGVPQEVIEESKNKMRAVNSAWDQVQKLKIKN